MLKEGIQAHTSCVRVGAPAGGSREEGRGLEPRKVKLRGGYRVGAEVPEDKDIGEEARKREASGWKDCPKSPGIM